MSEVLGCPTVHWDKLVDGHMLKHSGFAAGVKQ